MYRPFFLPFAPPAFLAPAGPPRRSSRLLAVLIVLVGRGGGAIDPGAEGFGVELAGVGPFAGVPCLLGGPLIGGAPPLETLLVGAIDIFGGGGVGAD